MEYGGHCTIVDNGKWQTMDNARQWTLVDNVQWWTMDNAGQWTIAQHVANGTNGFKKQCGTLCFLVYMKSMKKLQAF